MNKSWSDAEVAKAISVLQRCGTISEAEGKLRTTGAALRAGFQRARERGLTCGQPGDHLKGARVGKPQGSGVSPIPVAGARTEFERLVDDEGGRVDRAYLRKLEREVGRRDYLAGKLHDSLVAAFATSPIRLNKSDMKVRHVTGRRMITVMLSDIHFGLHVNKREVPGGGYDWQIAARRVARLATEVAAWKTQYRDDTDLHVVINGDVIAGLIHLDDAGVRKLTEQIHGATSILVAFVDYLAQHFQKITVSCVPGNHDRTTVMRQLAHRWDSHAHAIYLAMSLAFRDEQRVTFNIPMTGEAIIELPGGRGVALYTHGDVAPTVSNVGKALNLRSMISSLHRLNASGGYPKPILVFGVGHWHSPFYLDTGIGTILVNGSVIGPDSFAQNGCGIRGNEGRPSQAVFESVPGYDFGDCRFVRLSEADNDVAYDKVIATPNIERWLS